MSCTFWLTVVEQDLHHPVGNFLLHVFGITLKVSSDLGKVIYDSLAKTTHRKNINFPFVHLYPTLSPSHYHNSNKKNIFHHNVFLL